jgi:hypothetical protein
MLATTIRTRIVRAPKRADQFDAKEARITRVALEGFDVVQGLEAGGMKTILPGFTRKSIAHEGALACRRTLSCAGDVSQGATR